MLASVDMRLKTRVVWYVRTRPRRAISGTRSAVISRSAKRMDPESTGCVPAMELNSVVFPDPLGPMIPTISPSETDIDTALLATTPPKRLLAPSTARSALTAEPPPCARRGGGRPTSP